MLQRELGALKKQNEKQDAKLQEALHEARQMPDKTRPRASRLSRQPAF